MSLLSDIFKSGPHEKSGQENSNGNVIKELCSVNFTEVIDKNGVLVSIAYEVRAPSGAVATTNDVDPRFMLPLIAAVEKFLYLDLGESCRLTDEMRTDWYCRVIKESAKGTKMPVTVARDNMKSELNAKYPEGYQ